MEPTIEKFLQGIPFAGMGTTLERNGLIGVIREMIKANKYTVDYILNYCESVGYQRKMAEEIFEELTGLSPKLIINNNEYYNAPIYVPACTIAWGLAKSKKDVAFYVVPGSYGYSVMEKNETDTPTEITQTATIPEAIDELKKVAKNIQTLDKIITSKLLETEDIQSSANDIDQTAKPYFSDPIRELKKNFKNKVIDINGFEREAKKLVAEEKITVNEAEDLMDWKQRLVDEDESYANEVLQNNEEWNQLQGTEDDSESNLQTATDQVVGMASDIESLDSYAASTMQTRMEVLSELVEDAAQEWGVDKNILIKNVTDKLHNLKLSDAFLGTEKKSASKKVKSWNSEEDDEYRNSEEYLDSYEYLYSQLVNGNITEYKNGVKKLYQQGPSKLMEYMDWLEENNINPKEALKVMKNASKKVKSTLGFFAKPENEKEELVLKIADEIIDKSSKALEDNNWNGWNTQEERQQGIDIVKKAIAPIVRKYKTELQDEEIFNMLYDHNEDNNYHTENRVLEELLGKGGKPQVCFTKTQSSKKQASSENIDGIKVTTYDHGSRGVAYSAEGLTYDECDKVYTELCNMYDSVDTSKVQMNELKDKCHGYFLCKKSASKKVTAENIDLEDIEEEDKTEVEQEIDKIDETPIDELLEDNTPLDYFEKETQEDKVDTINDVVSRCITEFSDKFKDFDKYDVKMLSYKTKILAPYTPNQDEMIPDNEVNADAVLQVILAVNNKADDSDIKKVLAVFSITDGKMHWTGTVRDENDKVVAFTEQGLDSIFNDEEPEEVEEVI